MSVRNKVVNGLEQLDREVPIPWKESDLVKEVFQTKAPLAIRAHEGEEEQFVNSVLQLIHDAPKTRVGLLRLRQNFDNIVDEEYPTLYKDYSMKPIKKYVLNLRHTFNDFLEKQLPDGKLLDGVGLKDYYKQQTNYLTAKEMMAEKTSREIDNNDTRWKLYLKKNPNFERAINGIKRYSWLIPVGGVLYPFRTPIENEMKKIFPFLGAAKKKPNPKCNLASRFSRGNQY